MAPKIKKSKVTLMDRRQLEVADILQEHIGDYQRKYPLQPPQYKIVYDILNCRTPFLGGHVEQCDHCGTERITYNSCRNRHCPKCQSIPRERWVKARKAEILPVIYFHTVFTLPHDLNPIILCNKKIMLDILFQSVAETLLAFGHNPKNGLGGKLGFIALLHTWDQLLNAHFHLHCLIPGGAMTEGGTRWKPCERGYLFNEEALARVFRAKFIESMAKAYQRGSLIFPGLIAPYEKPEKFHKLRDTLYSKKWVVSVRDPIHQPQYVLEYLGRYTHRVAISNHRLAALKDGMVTFTYKNRKTNLIEQVTIEAVEFIRRFLLHALPSGFVRIRHFGFLANRNKTANLERVQQALPLSPQTCAVVKQSIEEIMLTLTGIDITICPCCKKGRMRTITQLTRYTGLNPKSTVQAASLRKAIA